MAKRLNKKVAFIGTAVFAIVAMILILGILHRARDPQKLIKDGDAAVKAANEAIDENIKIQEYKRAERSYQRAHVRAKVSSLKIDVLFKLVDMYIQMDMYTGTDQWRNVMGCWSQIIRIDSKNVKARYGQLKYFYILADTGIRQVWQEVRDQASEFIKVAEETNLLKENTAKWETVGMPEIRPGVQRLGPFLYLVRGRANLELARMGGVPDPDKLFAAATDDLKKVQEFEPDSVNAYWYLAQATIANGEILASRGNLEERNKAVEQAKLLLTQAVQIASNDPKAHINLLTVKLAIAQESGKEQVQALKSEYLSLTDKFPSSAEAFSAISRFYSNPWIGHKNLDKAIKAAEKAIRLDKTNVIYAMNMANLYYRKFSYYGQKPDIYKAIETAENALTLPDTQERKGPRNWANKINRASLYAFLAKCYIEQILEPCEVRADSETTVWLENAEQAVHEIEQVFGSGEEPQVIKWRGMLELAKGNRELAIRKLYALYEQLKASARPDAELSYTLAKIFKDTSEVGADAEFLVSALKGNIAWTKPEARLDYVDVLLKLNVWPAAIPNIDAFEEYFEPNPRSQMLRIKAYIGAKQFDEAKEELAKLRPDDPNTIKLNLELVQARAEQIRRAIAEKQRQESPSIISREIVKPPGEETADTKASLQLMMGELNGYRQLETELVRKLLPIEPNSVGQASITRLCKDYIAQGQISEAKDLVNQFLQYFPDNTDVLVYKQILSEPDPGKISQQREKEIEEQVLSNIADPIRRSVRLGIFYRENNELQKAVAELKKVLKAQTPPQKTTAMLVFEQAVGHLFDTALLTKDWQLAEQVVETAQRENLDKCQGQVFEAHLALAKADFKDALAKLDGCLKQRPIFSYAYMLRSSVNAALGNDRTSIEDIRKAASLNPLDGAIAKRLAITLYGRDQKLGNTVTSDQTIETRAALDRAVALNSSDLQLVGFYADYISQTEPLKALLIRDGLQKVAPSVQNTVRLGQLATKLAVEETDPRRREALFAVAGSYFEQAKKIDPNDGELLQRYAEYYVSRGMKKEAEQLLEGSQDRELLWIYYFRTGKFEQARNALEQLYKSNPKDPNVVRGLLFVAEKTNDKEGAKRYSEELLSLQDSVDNQLLQIQTFLKVGLIKDTEQKLQSFKERHPDEPKAMMLEAWLAKRQGQLEKAVELLNRALQNEQNNSIAWRLRGQINLLMANYDQALSDLKKSKALSDDPDTRLSIAKAYLRTGRDEDAITELKNVIDMPGAPIESRTLLEQIYLKLGRKEPLKRFYNDTIQKFPNEVFWYNRAGAFALNEGNFDEAEQLYKQAYLWKQQTYPEPATPGTENEISDTEYKTAFDGYLQALVLGAGTQNTSNWNPGKLNKVLEECSKYVDRPFAPIAFYRMAEAKLKLGDKNVAIEYCRKAIDKAGTNETLASEILLRMFLLLGPEEVTKYCMQKLATDPDSLAANWTMFNLAKINTEYNEAIDYINKCIKIAGPDTERRANYVVRKAELLTLAYEKTSDNIYLKQAIADYESLLAKMPNNTSVQNNLAYMLAENNERLSDALRYAKQAVEASPNNASFLDTYAYVLYKNDKFSQAAESSAAAIQQYELSGTLVPPEVYEHSGMIKEKVGAKEQALAYYKQALEIGVDKLPKEAIERIKKAIERLSQ